MNIGIILPAEPKKQQQIKLPKFLRVFETLFLDPEPLEVQNRYLSGFKTGGFRSTFNKQGYFNQRG